VDEYVGLLGDWRAQVVNQLREIVKQAAPSSIESIKWGQPVYEENGPFCYIKAHPEHVNLGFWRGSQLPDPTRLLGGDGTKMKHVRFDGPGNMPSDGVAALVRAAVLLNQQFGDPSR
jgi:hypothetical protein